MNKNVSSNTDDRLLGIETRLSKIETRLSEKDFGSLRLSNQVNDMEKSIIRLEDKMDKFQQEMEAVFTEFRSKIYNLLDPIAGQLKKFNEEQTIHEGQHEEIYQDVQKLKKIHPGNTHQPVVV